jgi:hypothetical protein
MWTGDDSGSWDYIRWQVCGVSLLNIWRHTTHTLTKSLGTSRTPLAILSHYAVRWVTDPDICGSWV